MNADKLPKWVTQVGSKYYSNVTHRGKRIYLGSYPTPEEAHERAALFRKENPWPKRGLWQPGDQVQ